MFLVLPDLVWQLRPLKLKMNAVKQQKSKALECVQSHASKLHKPKGLDEADHCVTECIVYMFRAMTL